jgi:hypothetical protein
VILTSGCFDGIHAGHVAFFQKLKRDRAATGVRRRRAGRIHRAREEAPAPLARRRPPPRVAGLAGVYEAFFHGITGVEDVLHAGHPTTRVPWQAFAKGLDWWDVSRNDDAALMAADRRGMAIIVVNSEYAGHNSDR